jgi:hypothetical protein
MKSSACIVFLLILTFLSLNFFTKPAACPMNYAGVGMDANVCACCAGCNHMRGSRHSVRGKFPGMCCHCGMCHITNPGIVRSGAKAGATIYLQLRTVACLPAPGAQSFRDYKTNPALVLLGQEKDRPPEVS